MALNQANIVMLILLLAIACQIVEGQTTVPISQRSTLRAYDADSKLLHDEFYIPIDQYSDPLHPNKDWTYFLSRVQVREYAFKKFSHSSMSATTIIGSIMLSDYEVLDACHSGDTLDYIVALNTLTNQTEVVALKTSGTTYVKNIAKTVKHGALLPETIRAKCELSGEFKSKGVYDVGVVGSYLSKIDPNILDMYVGRFNTRGNFTTNFYESETVGTSELAKAVYVDVRNSRIYAVVDINTNKYYQSSVYAPGEVPSSDNPNIAIFAFSFDFGTRLWVTVLGDSSNIDYFSGLSMYKGYLHVALTSHTDMFSPDESQGDIVYSKIRSDNGKVVSKKILGSATNDRALDIAATTSGVYIMATIGDNFLPHPVSGNIWQTNGGAGKTNFVVLLLRNSDSQLIDIEGFDTTTVIDPYPKRFTVQVSTGKSEFIFYSPRSNTDIAGLFITKFTDATKVFINDIAAFCTDSTNCNRCNANDASMCMSCVSGSMLFDNTCAATCPDGTYQFVDYSGTAQEVCAPCHFSCKTCLGPKDDQCLTCCTGGACGTDYNRVPSTGKCKCASSKVDSDGKCLDRCSTGLRGLHQSYCYANCPSDSIQYFDWGRTGSSQKYSDYSSGSSTQCSDSSHHLKFQKDGKGISISGPSGLKELPTEYTITFWVKPIGSFLAYGRDSYIAKLFDVISVYITTAGKIRFKLGDSGVEIEPTYDASKDSLDITKWNYISVSVKTTKSATAAQLYLLLSLAPGRDAVLAKAGEGTLSMPTFNSFVNMIYLGAQSISTPNSFDGYIKEFRFFKKFHSFDQLTADKLKIYHGYNYDDPNLISHWKLDEAYSATSSFYTIKDYSMSRLSVTVYLATNPDYPTFVNDSSIALNLCYYHDVADCLSLDKSDGKLSKFTFGAWRYSYAPDLNLADGSQTISNGDELLFSPKRDCLNYEARLYRRYNKWSEDAQNPQPTDELKDGSHYYLCYFTTSLNITFPLAQIYIGHIVDKIRPVELSAFRTPGVTEPWRFEDGDQAYGDTIMLGSSCTTPKSSNLVISRSVLGLYDPVTIMNFSGHQNIFFCYRSALASPTDLRYESVRYLEYKIVERPKINTQNQYTLTMNYDTKPMVFEGPLTETDQIVHSWVGDPWADCNPVNFLNTNGYTYQHGYLPYIWYGKDSGIHGMNSSSDILHVCWKSKARGAPDNWIRLKSALDASFSMRVLETENSAYSELPELESFDPPYGTTFATENTTEIKFNFHSEEVFPAKSSNGPGMLKIYRGAIKADGSIDKASAAPVLWQTTTLDDTTAKDKFKQGDIECSLAGKCLIQLSGLSKLKAGEIYYLSFFGHSFKNQNGKYLFGSTAPVATSMYDHMFQCRSFSIFSSNQTINGAYFSLKGLNLLSIKANAKMNGNDILAATFKTRALKMSLRITNSTSCSPTLIPSGSIKLSDITETSFSVANLDLRNCYQGDVYADFSIVRGIKVSAGVWTHLKKEYLKNIKIGSIGCHANCRHCTGPNSNQCLLCNDTTKILYQGSCVTSCPAEKPFVQTSSLIYNQQSVPYLTCVNDCGYKFYVETNMKCTSCNTDCLNCSGKLAGMCTACTNNKMLHKGICLTTCPTPFYTEFRDNSLGFRNYACVSTGATSPLSVKIQNFGYENKVQKNIQIYPKAEIYNADTTKPISSIVWSQVDPVPDSDLINIFFKDTSNNLLNTGSVIKLKMSAFNYMSESQSIKIRVDVTNSAGDVAIDIMEFYLNDAPFAQNTVFTNTLGASSKEAMVTNFVINVTDWYDSLDDIQKQLEFRTYFVYNKKNHMLSAYKNVNSISVQIPYFSKTKGLTSDITLCVEAKDKFDATSSVCHDYLQVVSNYNGDLDALFLPFASLDMSNHDNMLKLARSVQFILTFMSFGDKTTDYSHPASADYICAMDFHCNYNGFCDKRQTMAKCTCDYGYTGTFCQYTMKTFYIINDGANKAIDTLHSEYYPVIDSIDDHDIIFISSVLSGLLVDYDCISVDRTAKLMDLIDGIGNSEAYFAPKYPNDRRIVLDAISRFGARLITHFKIHFRKTNFEHSALLHGLARDDFADENLKNLENLYKKYRVALQSFIDKLSLRLNPGETRFIYTSFIFDVSIQHGYPNAFAGKDMNIQSNDVFWTIPATIFDNYQNWASNVQEIKFKLVKWIASPLLFDTSITNYLETNVTEVAVLNTAGTKIEITNLAENIQTKEPYSKTYTYDDADLHCKVWDKTLNKFTTSGCETFAVNKTLLMCQTCDATTLTTTPSYHCYCNSLEYVAAIYDAPTSTIPDAKQTMIYPDYYALDFWQDSFGFYLTIWAVCSLLIGLVAVLFCDQFPRRKILIRIYEKIKRREVMEGYEEEDDSSDSECDSSTELEEPSTAMLMQEGPQKRRSKLADRKIKKEEYHQVLNESVGVKDSKVNETEDALEMHDLGGGMLFGDNSANTGNKLPPTTSKLYNPHAGKTKNLAIPEESKELATSSVAGSKLSDSPRSKISQKDKDSKDKDNESQNAKSNKSSESEKEYEKLRNQEDREKERTNYFLRNIFIQGSLLQNFIWVDSYINPRHVRGALWFTNIVFIWYFVAVVFNNTKDPKKVPDFDRSTRELTFDEIWISIMAPWAAMIFVYIFCLILKLSPNRIKYTRTVKYLDYVMEEYRREQKLRYLMGYFILIAVNVMVFMYLVEFTALHGWKTSWLWWNTGSLGFFINTFLYDPICAVIHWAIYKFVSNKLGRGIMRCRNLKIYRPEI